VLPPLVPRVKLPLAFMAPLGDILPVAAWAAGVKAKAQIEASAAA
jgi:hypothetical protein